MYAVLPQRLVLEAYMVKIANSENTKNTLNIDFLNRLCAQTDEGMSYEDICEAFNINKRTAQRWVSTVQRLFPNYLMVRRTKRNKFFSVDFTKNSNFNFDFTNGREEPGSPGG